MTQQKLPPETSQKTFRGGRVRKRISLEIQTGTNTGETGGTNTRILDHIGTSPGMNTGASITLGVHTVSSLEVTPGTLGTSQEIIIDINIISIIRKMSTESRKETIIGTTTVPIQETDPGTPKEMTNPEIHLGETQEDSTETHLETDMMEEDRERGATAP